MGSEDAELARINAEAGSGVEERPPQPTLGDRLLLLAAKRRQSGLYEVAADATARLKKLRQDATQIQDKGGEG